MVKIISIANRKGGVGKTTTAVNIATAMAAIGKRVLILDMDPQGNATTSLGINKNKCLFSTYDIMINNCKAEDAIVKTDIKKFDILPSAPALAAAEIELIDVNKREYVLKNALNALSGKYDYILIDCPPSLNLITINALVSSDSVIVPLQSEFLALEGLTDLIKNINIIKKNFNMNEGKRYFTFYDGPPTANGKPHVGHIETRVMKDIIPRYKVMKGYKVIRKAGWDTHGLPVELEIEKSLGISGKEQIEEYGVEKFVKKCKESVFTYVHMWEEMTNKVGYWVDMEHIIMIILNLYGGL